MPLLANALHYCDNVAQRTSCLTRGYPDMTQAIPTEPAPVVRVSDNREQSRYELDVDGQIAYANYRRQGSTLVIPYVYAPPALRGTGASGRLLEGVMEIARGDGLKVVPLCGYAASWLRRHKEHRDLLA